MSSVHVLGFGSLLRGDDGFGLHVLRTLGQERLPEGVTLYDAGLAGPAALGWFEGCELAVVVDALALEHAPGTVRCFELGEVTAPARAAFSLHELDVAHLAMMLPIVFEGRQPPRVVVVGAEIVPPGGAFTMELSEEVARAVPAAAREVRRLLGAG